MGCTIPTYRALYHEPQLTFDDLVKHVSRHPMAGEARNHHTPEFAHLVSICVGQQHEIRELREEVKAVSDALSD